METVIPIGIQIGRYLKSLNLYRLGSGNCAKKHDFTIFDSSFDFIGMTPSKSHFLDIFPKRAPVYGTLETCCAEQYDFPKYDWVITIYGKDNIQNMQVLADLITREFKRPVHTVLICEENRLESFDSDFEWYHQKGTHMGAWFFVLN